MNLHFAKYPPVAFARRFLRAWRRGWTRARYVVRLDGGLVGYAGNVRLETVTTEEFERALTPLKTGQWITITGHFVGPER